MHAWRATPARGEAAGAQRELLAQARTLAGEAFDSEHMVGPVFATGHQAWLWHPGILAKLFAVDAAARRCGGTAIHLVVDHDVNAALRLDVPVRDGDHLRSQSLTLAEENTARPTGYRLVDAQAVAAELRRARDLLGHTAAVDLDPAVAAAEAAAAADPPSAAELVTAIQAAWLAKHGFDLVHRVVVVESQRLLTTAAAGTLLSRMLHDARRCAAAYNAAVAAHPEAGVPPLLVERERVELPVWAVGAVSNRERLFADLADSRPAWGAEDGSVLTEAEMPLSLIWPRALLLSALMRHFYSDLFVHGTGGGVYDQATETWWHDWTGGVLNPMATATADVRLDLDAPLANPDNVARAVWYQNHLPHNLDRHVRLRPEDAPLIARKAEALTHMDDDRDRRRRRDLFRVIHEANAELGHRHPEPLLEAARAVERARTGLANRAIAGRRDWCFMLYPPERLHDLRAAVERQAEAWSASQSDSEGIVSSRS